MRKGTKIAVVISTAALTFGLWMMVLGKPQYCQPIPCHNTTHHNADCHR